MSDAQLREELESFGFSPGPITDTTRGVLKKKLQNLKAGSARSQKTSKESERVRKSQGRVRNKRREPIQDDRRDSEEEEDVEESLLSYRTNVSARPSRSYGGSGRVEREEDRIYLDSKSGTSSHVEDTGLWRRHESSLHRTNSSRATSNYTDYLGYEHRSSLGTERIPITTIEYGSLGPEIRSTQGGERFPRTTFERASLGLESRSSQGGERFPRTPFEYGSLVQEVRSSQGGERFPRTTFEHGSLGLETRSSQGGERFPRTNYDLGSLGQEVSSLQEGERFSRTNFGSSGQDTRFSLGSERFPRNTADSSGFLGHGVRPRSVEKSSWSGLPLNRDESRHLSRYGGQDGDDQLSYNKYPGRGTCGQSKPNWSRTLEYYLSKLVRSLSVGLCIIFFGILIMKSGIFYSTQQDDIKLIPPNCEGKHDKYCQTMQKQIILQILSELYDFLSLEAGSFECGNPSGLSSKCIPIKRAKEHITDVLRHEPEKFDSAVDWLLDRDEHLGIWAKGEDGEIVTTGSLVFCVESSRPRLGITCRLTKALYTAISNLFLALFGVFVLWLFLIYLRYHWRKLEDEEKQMFAMVDKIIDVVKLHYKGYQQAIEQHPYIGIAHVRDMLIMPQDRKRLKKVWDRAVQFVEDNESRLRTESQRVAGADLLVWRWTQTRHEIPSARFSPNLLSSWGK